MVDNVTNIGYNGGMMTVPQVADKLGIPPRTVWGICERNNIGRSPNGRLRILTMRDLERIAGLHHPEYAPHNSPRNKY